MKTKGVVFGCTAVILIVLLSSVFLGCNSNSNPSNSFTLILILLPGEGGTIQQSPLPNPDGKYSPGARVRLEARSKEGFSFIRWSGDAQGTVTSITITMDQDKSINAEFNKNNTSAITREPASTLPSSSIRTT